MSETYEDIMEELDHLRRTESFPVEQYMYGYGLQTEDGSENEIRVLRHLANRVAKAVAGNYKHWYLLNGSGERLYIGDWVESPIDDAPDRVAGFIITPDGPKVRLQDYTAIPVEDAIKAPGDTQEAINRAAEKIVQSVPGVDQSAVRHKINALLKRQRDLYEERQ